MGGSGGGFSDHFGVPSYQADVVAGYLKQADPAANAARGGGRAPRGGSSLSRRGASDGGFRGRRARLSRQGRAGLFGRARGRSSPGPEAGRGACAPRPFAPS